MLNEMRKLRSTLDYFKNFECRHHGKHWKVKNLKSEGKIVNVCVERKSAKGCKNKKNKLKTFGQFGC